jgi:Gly-Xaa carboxypeptidase
VSVVKAYDTTLLQTLATDFNLSYTAFGVNISDKDAPSYGTLTLTDAWDAALEPAPITPTGEGAAPFHLLSGTIKATFNAHRSLSGPNNIAIAPSFMSGNTGVYRTGISPEQC